MNRGARKATGAVVGLVLVWACGSDGGRDQELEPLSDVELQQGIGPVRDLELAALDDSLVEEGRIVFGRKCTPCHRLSARMVAPPLGDVLERRRPEFVMNMILNADEMVERHPVIRQLLSEYFTPMPVLVDDHSEARAILEYLRSVQPASGR
jgi:hypothetical protein